MADFKKSYLLLTKLEFSNNPDLFLHTNPGEQGYTLGGVYQKVNPTAVDWDFIDKLVIMCEFDIKRASRMLYADPHVKKQVFEVFKKHYWNKILLDEIQSQVIADNIFLSGVHIGTRSAVKLAQKIAQTQQDGIMGPYTIKALSYRNEAQFKKEFDMLEFQNYNQLVEDNPKLGFALNGWIARTYAV